MLECRLMVNIINGLLGISNSNFGGGQQSSLIILKCIVRPNLNFDGVGTNCIEQHKTIAC
jgi:hypothetical protein